MTERIDHGAVARTILRGQSNGVEAADVHATLALVEQQRIANLIAYRSTEREHRGGGDGETVKLNVEIREALGLS